MEPQPVTRDNFMVRFVEWFLWGLFMGMGWSVATAVLNFIVMLLQHHT